MMVWDMVAGLLSGALAGMLGVGGGFIVVPYLLWSQPSLSISEAISASAVAVFPVVVSSALQHRQAMWQNAEARRLVQNMIPGVALAAVVAAAITPLLPRVLLTTVFGVIVGLVGLSGLTAASPRVVSAVTPHKRRWFPRLQPAHIIGAGGGLIGAGGSYLAVPYLVECRQQPVSMAVHQAAVLSAFVVGGAGAVALLRGTCTDTVSFADLATLWRPVAAIGGGGLVGVAFGVRIATRLPGDRLKTMFNVYLLLLSMHLLFRAIQGASK